MDKGKIGKYFSEGRGAPRCPAIRSDDLASLIAGVKQVIFANANSAEELASIKELCADLRLRLRLLEKTKGLSRDSDSVDVLLGRSAARLRAAERSYSDLTSFDWGVSLDYPACCVGAYVSWRKQPVRADLIAHTAAKSPKGRPVPFLLNNVYNFHSRAFDKGDNGNYFAFRRLNPGVDLDPVLPWHPCSYACKASLEAGRRIFEVLAHYRPAAALQRRALLGRPVLFWDKFRFAALEGASLRVGGGFELSWEKLGRPASLLGEKLAKTLAGAGRLRLTAAGGPAGPAARRLLAGGVVLPFSA